MTHSVLKLQGKPDDGVGVHSCASNGCEEVFTFFALRSQSCVNGNGARRSGIAALPSTISERGEGHNPFPCLQREIVMLPLPGHQSSHVRSSHISARYATLTGSMPQPGTCSSKGHAALTEQ